ncbi:MAG: hypothetical protein ACEQSQ_00150 [Candidatus Paceibacteria bacterium]
MISDIDKNHIEAFLFRVGSEIVNDAKDIAPFATGNLQADIQVWKDNISNLEIEIGNSSTTGTGKENPGNYALYVHEGTGIYARNQSKTNGRLKKGGIKPQPYLENAVNNYDSKPALDDLGDKICEDVFENIKKGFNK